MDGVDKWWRSHFLPWYQRHFCFGISSSRWGTLPLLISLSMFFVALSLSFYCIELSVRGSETMTSFLWPPTPVLLACYVSAAFALVFLVISVILFVLWAWKPLPVDNTLATIHDDLVEMKAEMKKIANAIQEKGVKNNDDKPD
jgi:hypothetical protein